MQSTTEFLTPQVHIAQAALLLERIARQDSPARYNKLISLATNLKAIVVHLERVLNPEAR